LSAGRILAFILVPGLLVAAAILTFRFASGEPLPDSGPWVFVAVDRTAGPDAISVIGLSNTTVFTAVQLDCGGDCKPFGLALSPAGDRLYVSNSQADSVTVIDLASLQVTATWSLTAPAPGTRTPRELAVSPDGARLYVSNQAAGTVSILGTDTGRVITETAVGLSPRGIDFLPDGSAVVVTQGDASTPGSVSVLSPITYGVVLSRPIPAGEQAVAVKVVSDPVNSIFVLEQAVGGSGANQVEELDFNLQPKAQPLQVGNGPVAMVYDSRTLTLYVACGTDKDIWKVTLSDRQVGPLKATFNPNPPTPFNGLALNPGSDGQPARLVVVGGGGSAGGNIALAGFVSPQSPQNSSTIQADPNQNSTPWGVVIYTKPVATPTPTLSPTPVSPAPGCADPARRCLFLPVLAR
jgi:YVTN family beta-propeller protein